MPRKRTTTQLTEKEKRNNFFWIHRVIIAYICTFLACGLAIYGTIAPPEGELDTSVSWFCSYVLLLVAYVLGCAVKIPDWFQHIFLKTKSTKK